MSRTPAVLSWLASDHSHVLGRIDRLRQKEAQLKGRILGHQEAIVGAVRKLLEVEMEIGRLSKLADLNRDVSEMHPTPFTMDGVAAVRPHHNPYLLAHGAMTRLIFTTLAKHGGTASTDQILEQIIKAGSITSYDRRYIKKRVVIRLWRLAYGGKLRANDPTNRSRNRMWSLPETSE